MIWLKKEGCSWNEETFSAAAEHGSFASMIWLKKGGCPWDGHTFRSAAYHGSLDNNDLAEGDGLSMECTVEVLVARLMDVINGVALKLDNVLSTVEGLAARLMVVINGVALKVDNVLSTVAAIVVRLMDG